ncbi:MAG: HD domain-containing protein [Oscillospiraceae bacterium]|jgi:metal-dependent HD superfamily phosphatase/phosphodiesterase|nr:HD domain-containing protein [Oscillospiraceae bacterium]
MTISQIKKDPAVQLLLEAANRHLAALGYTDHGPRHAGFVSKYAAMILESLGYDERMTRLAAIAGYLHDVGNSVNRNNHSASGACLMFPLLLRMEMPFDEVTEIITAIGNHEEDTGAISSPIAAAVVIADKADAHKSRVRNGAPAAGDIHDRVNFSIQRNRLCVDADTRVIVSRIDMNETSSVMEYLTIYMTRIVMCEKAAAFLGCTFDLVINGRSINGRVRS